MISYFRAAMASTMVLALCAASTTSFAQQRIVQWSPITNTSTADNFIALGYPVPMPVDTPLPFDGFRSYAGLHMRHQDLAVTTALVHPHDVGRTRSGRTIWAYRLGDADKQTVWGLPEAATLTNGGIHAREWQTPEIVTGIMEKLAAQGGDHGYYRYLLDNVNMTLIPVYNIDGFLQTQRYPTQSWLGTDPDDPNGSPRDGRMRRKNMLNVDEVMTTQGDHLNGIDLNRNNPPFWATSTQSSSQVASIVYHGASAHSEPEAAGLIAAAALGPASELRLYTDVHSFGRVLFWSLTNNARLTNLTQGLLSDFAAHHAALPNGRSYKFPTAAQMQADVGIGSTDELFAHQYQVPAWTLEVEPPGDPRYHRNEPLCGGNYGGVVENCHDGFVLPDSQIRRVRENVAETMISMFYRQAGPPSINATRIFDQATGALVYESQWQVQSPTTRQQVVHQTQALQLDRDYILSHNFDKPMRWRVNGTIAAFPGTDFTATSTDELRVGSDPLTLSISNRRWLNQPGSAPLGYQRYVDDTSAVDLRLPRAGANSNLISASTTVSLRHNDFDMTGRRLDANPATAARWANGAWAQYEDSAGAQTDFGGTDATVAVNVSDQNLGDPFVIVPGTSSAWFDPSRNGEGFVMEVLSDTLALAYFFTYDANGEQDWYTMVGEIRGNRVLFAEVIRSAGGVFGPSFDPSRVTRTVVGSATVAFGSCDSGWMDWEIDGTRGRLELSRLTRVLGLECEGAAGSGSAVGLSGSWYDPSHDGEGYVLERLSTGGAIVYWFSYDPQGNRRWYFGSGDVVNNQLQFNNLLISRGPRFGATYNPADLQLSPWGSLTLNLGCDSGSASYNGTLPGFGSGILQLRRLTRLSGLACLP